MFKPRKYPKTLSFSFEDASKAEVQAGFEEEISLLDLALRHRIPLSNSCGGMGTCGTCRIVVLAPESFSEPRNELESEMAEMRSFHPNERLACQTEACHGMKICVPALISDEKS